MSSALSSDVYKDDCVNIFTGLDMPGRSLRCLLCGTCSSHLGRYVTTVLPNGY